jgi:hypothetical protein
MIPSLSFTSLISAIVALQFPYGTIADPLATVSSFYQKRDDACGFSGNSDLYGLGIRLGVYFQWTSALIIYVWYPEGRKDLAEAYLSFLFALIVAVLVITGRADPTYAAEILILTYIIFGGILTAMSIGVRQHHKLRASRTGALGFITSTFVLAVTSVYCSWFWLRGIRHSFRATPCGTYGFLFAKVSLFNTSVTKFFAALSIWLAITYCLGFGMVLHRQVMYILWRRRYGYGAVSHNPKSAPRLAPEPLSQSSPKHRRTLTG